MSNITKDLQISIEAYLHAIMHSGIIRDTDNQILTPEYFPDVVLLMMNEDSDGRVTSGFMGWSVANKVDVYDAGVLVPRQLQLACLELLRPYATSDRPDLMSMIARSEQANAEYLTAKAIEESGATNVTQLH